MTATREPTAGIVLAGGRSERMGAPKAELAWGETSLLDHVAGLLAAALDGPIVVVRAPGQPLPPVTATPVRVVDDPREGRGPVQGIAAGLAAADGAGRTYISAVDVPFLEPRFVRAVLAALDADHDVALPVVDGHHQPLAAAYRTALAPLAEELAAAGLLRPADLYARCRVRRLDARQLPGAAASVRNLNTPEDYRRAAARRLTG